MSIQVLNKRWRTIFTVALISGAAVACKKADPEPATPHEQAPVAEQADVAVEAETDAEAAGLDLSDILASDMRSEEHKERDEFRNPQETLEFFHLKPDSTVLEIGPGAGWYSEILAPYLAPKGTLIVGLPAPEGPSAKYRAGWERLQRDSPELYGSIQTIVFDAPIVRDAEDGSMDLVLAVRSIHGWVNNEALDEGLAAVHRLLKPGGTLGIVAHRTADENDPAASAKKGYLPQAWVIEQVEAAGFEFEESSELNANAKDSADHPEGVWALPPNLSVEDEERRTKLAQIGESDRMTLRFTKR